MYIYIRTLCAINLYTSMDIQKSTFHVHPLNIHAWICQIYFPADIVHILYVYTSTYISKYSRMYFSCISAEYTYMDQPNIFSGGHCMYIVNIYFHVHFEIFTNVLFMYICWIYVHGSAKHIFRRTLYVYCKYILPCTFRNIHECTFHAYPLNVRTWIYQVHLLADIV